MLIGRLNHALLHLLRIFIANSVYIAKRIKKGNSLFPGFLCTVRQKIQPPLAKRFLEKIIFLTKEKRYDKKMSECSFIFLRTLIISLNNNRLDDLFTSKNPFFERIY